MWTGHPVLLGGGQEVEVPCVFWGKGGQDAQVPHPAARMPLWGVVRGRGAPGVPLWEAVLGGCPGPPQC